MHIGSVSIKNFRNFLDCQIPLNEGLTVIVGENNAGKSNLLEALNLIFAPSSSRQMRSLSLADFSADFEAEDKKPPEIRISCNLERITTDEEKSITLRWRSADPRIARLTYVFRCDPATSEQFRKGHAIPIEEYSHVLFGGDSETGDEFEHAQLAKISFEIWDALRDAESDLQPGSRGRLARTIRRFPADKKDTATILRHMGDLNADIEKAFQVQSVQTAINENIQRTVGLSDLGKVRLTATGSDYNALIDTLKIEVEAGPGSFHSIGRAGLGFNNIVLISSILTDYQKRIEGRELALQVMAIEEPEAHLHPALQKALNRNFEQSTPGAQVIATTHSTHIASSVLLDSIVVLHSGRQGKSRAIRVGTLFPENRQGIKERGDLERYLDATKSTLFFCKSVLLVEGISELILLPILASPDYS